MTALTSTKKGRKTAKIDPEPQKLWDLADSRPERPGSVGPLNREEIYQREIPQH